MDMAPKSSYLSYLVLFGLSPLVSAGEWTFDPSISVNETYTDKADLLTNSSSPNYVNQTSARLNTSFVSNRVQFSLNGNSTYASYSRDHDLDRDFKTLTANSRMTLWTNGPALTASASIQNQSRNTANNSLADIVSGDTIETQQYKTGFEYSVTNSAFVINSAVNYNFNQSEDNIGESEGVSARFNTQNGNSLRYLFWQVDSNYSKRENNSLSGENYNYRLKLGFYTPYNLTPYVSVYDENSTGSISNNQSNGMTSWGTGLKWQLSSHLLLDISYNYVDNNKNSDHLSANISWQPSSRTSLQAGFSQRFYGDSYNLSFNHSNRKLTNNITYTETVQAFDRNNYQLSLLGYYFCPSDSIASDSLSNCYAANDKTIDLDSYRLVPVSEQVLLPSDDFSLNKSLSWSSTLNLTRTSFSLNISNNESERLTTKIINNTLVASLSINRKISRRSNLSLSYSFSQLEIDKDKRQSSGQEDFYRTVATAYTRDFANSLSTSFSIQYLNRDSSNDLRTYEETRASINIKKNF